MRNKYPGRCYVCGETVQPGDGHFERDGKGGWRVRHGLKGAYPCKKPAREKQMSCPE